MPPGRHFEMRARRADAAALAALALAVYANTLHADFTFDDQFAVVSNADVLDGARGSATASPPFPSDPSTAEWDDRPARRASSLWRNDYWGQNLTSDASHKSWRPLTVLTFRLNAAIGGLEPSPPTIPTPHPDDGTAPHHPPRPRLFGFHALNVILHALAVLLSHRLLLRLAPALLPDRHPDARRAFAWLAAALLAAHPVRSEAVASVVGRADVLAAALATLAILAHADRKPWFAAAATGAAALCKETGVTVLAPLAAWDLAGLPGPDRGRAGAGDSSRDGRDGGSSSPVRSSSSTFSSSPLEILTRLAPPTFAVGVYLAARRAATGASTLVRIYREVENPLAFSDDAYSRRLSLAHLHATYAWLTAWPARLSCDRSHACVEPITSAYDARFLFAAAAYAASATALIRGAVAPPGPAGTPSRARAWVWIASAAPLVPASNVFFYVGTYVAERLLYAPALGACVLLAEAVTRIATDATHSGTAGSSASSASACFRSERLASKSRRARWRAAASGSLALAALTCACARACARNVAWSTDDSLFAAAERACPRSAKFPTRKDPRPGVLRPDVLVRDHARGRGRRRRRRRGSPRGDEMSMDRGGRGARDGRVDPRGTRRARRRPRKSRVTGGVGRSTRQRPGARDGRRAAFRRRGATPRGSRRRRERDARRARVARDGVASGGARGGEGVSARGGDVRRGERTRMRRVGGTRDDPRAGRGHAGCRRRVTSVGGSREGDVRRRRGTRGGGAPNAGLRDGARAGR